MLARLAWPSTEISEKSNKCDGRNRVGTLASEERSLYTVYSTSSRAQAQAESAYEETVSKSHS